MGVRPLVYALLPLVLTACEGAPVVLDVLQGQPDAAPEAAPTPDAPAPDAPADAPATDAPADAVPESEIPDARPEAAAPDAEDEMPVYVDSATPAYSASCVPGTPWQDVCVLANGTTCNGHRWQCVTDGGMLDEESAPGEGVDLPTCQDYGSSNSAGYFCCC